MEAARPAPSPGNGGPTISVVVPAYNEERYIAEALDSILAQSRPALEVIVVDDGSTDGTVTAVGPYLERVRLIQQENRGCPGAFDTGFREAKGEFVALCPADDVWEPQKLETRLAFRTRLLDCFWAGLPVVSTAGDELRERIDRDGLGMTLPEGDADAVASGLAAVLERGKEVYSEGLRLAAERYAWSTVSEPLVRFVTSRSEPTRLGSERQGGRFSALRSELYSVARRFLNAVGLGNWPRA